MTRIPLVISFWFMITTYVIHILDESLLGGSFVLPSLLADHPSIVASLPADQFYLPRLYELASSIASALVAIQ